LESLKFLHGKCWQQYRRNGEVYPFPANVEWKGRIPCTQLRENVLTVILRCGISFCKRCMASLRQEVNRKAQIFTFFIIMSLEPAHGEWCCAINCPLYLYGQLP
jgi:hypothetical protein